MPAAVSREHARTSWTYSSFSVIQLDTPCQATLGKQAELGYDELVKLSRHCQQTSVRYWHSWRAGTYLLGTKLHGDCLQAKKYGDYVCVVCVAGEYKAPPNSCVQTHLAPY